MKLWERLGKSLSLTLVAHAVVATNFSYYQEIIDRAPFGEVAPVAETNAAAPVAAESFTKDYELKAIIDDGAQLQVALLNKKTSKHVYLNVGQELEDMQLVSADYDKEEAVLKIGGETLVIKLHPEKDKGAAAAGTPSASLFGMPRKSEGIPEAAGPFGPASPDSARKPFFADLKRRGASPFQRLGTNMPFQTKSLESFFKPNTNIPLPFVSPFRPSTEPFKPAAPPGAAWPESPAAGFPFVPVKAPEQSGGAVQPSAGEAQPQVPTYPQTPYQPLPFMDPVEEGQWEEYQE
ncbi:MAG: hypothetical protein HYV35_10730 [Lentisphaerae bacterium]|nr:hypothetical protein [Lentisphaerota bacterium]